MRPLLDPHTMPVYWNLHSLISPYKHRLLLGLIYRCPTTVAVLYNVAIGLSFPVCTIHGAREVLEAKDICYKSYGPV